jgi:hypothetical protein
MHKAYRGLITRGQLVPNSHTTQTTNAIIPEAALYILVRYKSRRQQRIAAVSSSVDTLPLFPAREHAQAWMPHADN